MTSCLTLRQLKVKREKNSSRFTLTVPELNIHRGRILGVVGPSGCGKSTLLDVLALILRPELAEEFSIRKEDSASGIDLMNASENQLASIRSENIGYVLQSGGLLSFLSVRDNILLPGRLLGISEKTLSCVMENLTERLGIVDQLSKKPQHLSGGQRQRVAIARALISRPTVVLADEPTAAVDQDTAWEICEIFRTLAKDMDTALVVVSHDQTLVRQFCDEQVEFRLYRHSPMDVEAITHVLRSEI